MKKLKRQSLKMPADIRLDDIAGLRELVYRGSYKSSPRRDSTMKGEIMRFTQNINGARTREYDFFSVSNG